VFSKKLLIPIILVIIGVIFIIIPFDPMCSGEAECITGKVTKVIDGDTIKVDDNSIRFALTSTPEINEEGGMLAKEYVEKICPVGSTVLVDEDDMQTDGSYGRMIGLIKCNGVILNESVLESGYGEISTRYCKTSEFANSDWAKRFGC
jgi:micrococcal nuclease